jgi:hypothetical protein
MIAPVSTCLICNQAMITVEPDQLTHPCCDPDDNRRPSLDHEAVAGLLADLAFFRRQPGRCACCGSHPATQGHLADCDSKDVKQYLFPNDTVCRACGEPFDQPGFTSRCRPRHQAGTS